MKNKLREFVGVTVRLIDKNSNRYIGKVGDYIFPEDNEPEGIDGIILDHPKKNDIQLENLIQFNADEIIDIEIL